MRIDSTLATAAIHAGDVRDAKPSSQSSKATDSSSVVKLSSAASTMPVEAANPKVTARIAHIRELLATGEYPVDLDQLASRIVDDEVLRGSK